MSKRFINGKEYQKIRLMYQDEAGFGRISKLGTCWSPKGHRPSVPSIIFENIAIVMELWMPIQVTHFSS